MSRFKKLATLYDFDQENIVVLTNKDGKVRSFQLAIISRCETRMYGEYVDRGNC